jgi:hypothetical protein
LAYAPLAPFDPCFDRFQLVRQAADSGIVLDLKGIEIGAQVHQLGLTLDEIRLYFLDLSFQPRGFTRL